MSCKNENRETNLPDKETEFKIDSIISLFDLSADYFNARDDSDFSFSSIDNNVKITFSSIKKAEYIVFLLDNIEKMRLHTKTGRVNENLGGQVNRDDSCLIFSQDGTEKYRICDGFPDFHGGTVLYGDELEKYILLHCKGFEFATTKVVSRDLWETELELPYISRVSPNKKLLIATEYPMHYGNLVGETLFSQFGRLYVYRVEDNNLLKSYDSFRVHNRNRQQEYLLSSVSMPFFSSDNELYAILTIYENGELNFNKKFYIKISIN